jgi:hypothetical protein
MNVAGQGEPHDAGVVDDDNDNGEGAEKVETGLALAIREARINCSLAHRFMDARNVAEVRAKQEAGFGEREFAGSSLGEGGVTSLALSSQAGTRETRSTNCPLGFLR